jgi:hypothetical protein
MGKMKDTIKMKFGKTSYVRNQVSNFKYAWQHPIISCRLCIKYIFNWIMRLDYAYAPYVHRFSTFFFSLVLRAFLWIYFGMTIGILTNDLPDGMRVLTEIPFVTVMAFMLVLVLLVVTRFVIVILEKIRLVKTDQIFLYGVGVSFVYGFLVLMAIGSALMEDF